MIACEPAASTCTPDRSAADQWFYDGPSEKTPFCSRTVEILTVLNDVFDALAPADCGIEAR